MKKKVWKVWIFVSSQVVPSLLFLPFVFLFYLSWFLNFRRSFYFRFFCEYSLFFIRVFPCSFFICLLFSSEGGCHIGIAEIRQKLRRWHTPYFALIICTSSWQFFFSNDFFLLLVLSFLFFVKRIMSKMRRRSTGSVSTFHSKSIDIYGYHSHFSILMFTW